MVKKPRSVPTLLLLLLIVIAPLCLILSMLAVKLIDPPANISIVGDIFLWSLPPMVAIFLYFLYLVRKSDMTSSKKVAWAAMMLFWFPFTGPIFWYTELWMKRAR